MLYNFSHILQHSISERTVGFEAPSTVTNRDCFRLESPFLPLLRLELMPRRSANCRDKPLLGIGTLHTLQRRV